jgi:hypothetical protein
MELSQNTFPYRPLPTSSFENSKIRLLHLHPGDFDDPIYCGIYHATIGKKLPNPKYNALSYVWGDATQTKPIQLGYYKSSRPEVVRNWSPDYLPEVNCYETFQVTKNLENGLRYLRDRTLQRVLWVDAICINQSDIDERSLQVQEMGHIYRGAARVHIWLGSMSEISLPTSGVHCVTEISEVSRSHQV